MQPVDRQSQPNTQPGPQPMPHEGACLSRVAAPCGVTFGVYALVAEALPGGRVRCHAGCMRIWRPDDLPQAAAGACGGLRRTAA